LSARFEALRAQKRIDQTPTYSSFSDADGSDYEVGIVAVPVAPDPAAKLANWFLPYLIDRKDQNDELDRIIYVHRQKQAVVPLICFFRGNVEQCLAEYQKCLELEYLSRLLGIPRKMSVRFKLVGWPGTQNRGRRKGSSEDGAQREFSFDLARNTYRVVLVREPRVRNRFHSSRVKFQIK